jgi:SAM-dependent methyltransferase
MNEFTLQAKEWLDQRFSRGGKRPYQPHFDNADFGKGESGFLSALAMAGRITMALSRMNFENIIDIGAADGFNAAFFRRMSGVPTIACDLSSEALYRGRERFGLMGVGIDSHQLPFKSDSFDVVVCNETIEHIHDPVQAMLELHRIAKRFVIVSTLEYEPIAFWRDYEIRSLNPDWVHAHRTLFTHTDFEQLFADLDLMPQLQDFGSISPFELNDQGLSLEAAKQQVARITSPGKFDYRKYGVMAIVKKNGSKLNETGRISQEEIIDKLFEPIPMQLDGPPQNEDFLMEKLSCTSCVSNPSAQLTLADNGNELVCSSCQRSYPIVNDTLLLYPQEPLSIKDLSLTEFNARYPNIDRDRALAVQTKLMTLRTSSTKGERAALRIGKAGINLALHPVGFTRYQVHKLESRYRKSRTNA